MDKNPWQVENIEEFSYFNCPECVFRSKEENFFEAHAVENHPLSLTFFGDTKGYFFSKYSSHTRSPKDIYNSFSLFCS